MDAMASSPTSARGKIKPYAPLFLQQTFAMVSDPSTNDIVAWSGPDSFIVKDQNRLASEVLPKYFKHNNFSSFVRQLNGYGFRKVSADVWNFKHEKFVDGHPELLREMTRRKTPKHQPAPGAGVGPTTVAPKEESGLAGRGASPGGGVTVAAGGRLAPTGLVPSASLASALMPAPLASTPLQLTGPGGVTEALVTELESMRKANAFLMEEILRLRQSQDDLMKRIDQSVETLSQRTESNRAQISGILSLLQAAVNQPRRVAAGVSTGSLRMDDTYASAPGSHKRGYPSALDTPQPLATASSSSLLGTALPSVPPTPPLSVPPAMPRLPSGLSAMGGSGLAGGGSGAGAGGAATASASAPKRAAVRAPGSPAPVPYPLPDSAPVSPSPPAVGAEKRAAGSGSLRTLADAATVNEAVSALRRSPLARRRTQSASALLEDGKLLADAARGSPAPGTRRGASPLSGTPLLAASPVAQWPAAMDGGYDLFGMPNPAPATMPITPIQPLPPPPPPPSPPPQSATAMVAAAVAAATAATNGAAAVPGGGAVVGSGATLLSASGPATSQSTPSASPGPLRSMMAAQYMA